MTAGQRTGNKALQWVEAAAADTPFASGKAAKLNEATDRAFAGTVMRKMGASGKEIATPDAVNRAVINLNNKFNTLSTRNTLRPDRQLADDFLNTVKNYTDSVIPSQRAAGRNNIQEIVDDIYGVMKTNGNLMSGQLYQTTRSRFGKMAEGLRGSDPQLSEAIDGIKRSLDDAMFRSVSPADKAAWQEVRKQWKNWKAIEKARGGPGSSVAEGFISPSQLRTAVAGQNRGQYVRGKGDMAELARAGEAILRPLPQSGTAPRAMAKNLIAPIMLGFGGNMISPGAGLMMAAAPAISGRLALSRPVQAYFGNQALAASPADRRRAAVMNALLGSTESRLGE